MGTRGPPETWSAQLEKYYRQEPVFALLGGITTGEWAPIHEFSEPNRIPCLFPVTDYPVIPDSDWYTLYFSMRHYREGETAARFIRRSEEIPNEAALDQAFWKKLASEHPGTVLASWLDFEHLSAIDELATGDHGPLALFVSSTMLGESQFSIPDPVRDFKFITHPNSFP